MDEKVLRSIMRKAGIKVTFTRSEVLKCLLTAGKPLSHADIQTELSGFDRVTLYRTLDAFVAADIAHQVQGMDGTWRFCAHESDGASCPAGHPHFMCTKCGKMICLSDQSIQRVVVPDGSKVDGKQLVVYGACRECGDK